MILNLVIIFIFLFVNITNAMDLLEKKATLENFPKEWEFVSDQVMGGVSTGKIDLLNPSDERFIRLSGNVSTENNGGFIQFRSEFNFEKDDYKGIRIRARGIPSEYYVHIRTNLLFLPWQYYSGKFTVKENWENIEILFDEFKKSNFYQPAKFDSSQIKSIGFVAFGKSFDARLDIIEAELF